MVLGPVGKRVEQAVPDHGRADRKGSGGEALADAHDVGIDPRLFKGEHAPGAPHAHGDLVENQQDLVFPAAFPQAAQVPGGMHAHAAGALAEGFDDNRGQLVAVPVQDVFHGPHAFHVARSG